MGETASPVNPRLQQPVAVAHDPVQTASQNDAAQMARIRSNMEQTRVEMSATIDALQEKLDPAVLKEKAKEQIKEKASQAYDSAKANIRQATTRKAEQIMANVSDTFSDMTGRTGAAMRDTGSSVVDYVKENPVPLALVGIGLGMLAFNARRRSHDIYATTYRRETQGYCYPDSNVETEGSMSGLADRARETASNIAGSARSMASRASESVSSAADSARQAGSDLADRAREQFNRLSDQAVEKTHAAQRQFNSTLNDSPIALGLAVLAAGAIVGLSMPSTRVEQEYMGEARDQLFDRAKSKANEAAEKVQHIAEDAAESIKNVAGLAAKVSDAAS